MPRVGDSVTYHAPAGHGVRTATVNRVDTAGAVDLTVALVATDVAVFGEEASGRTHILRTNVQHGHLPGEWSA